MTERHELAVDPPKYLFISRTNTELGADVLELADDGSVVFRGVVKKVTESMLSSYPRTMLDEWTPNRAALRFARDELEGRKVRDFETGEELDAQAVIAAAG